MKISSLERVVLVVTFAFSLGIALPSASNAEPGRTFEVSIDASTYAAEHPTNLKFQPWWGEEGTVDTIDIHYYQIFGARAGDNFEFNISKVTNGGDFLGQQLAIIAYFLNGSGFSINFSKNEEILAYEPYTYAGITGYEISEAANGNSYKLQVTLGENPEFPLPVPGRPELRSLYGPVLGVILFPSEDNSLFIWELLSALSAPPAPAPALRQTSNLSFDQSLYGTDTLSDPDGQLRKTLDLINAKYGNLIK